MKTIICPKCSQHDSVNPEDVIHFPEDFKCRFCGTSMKRWEE